jgi:DNA-binding XRE family transcriptional regulator
MGKPQFVRTDAGEEYVFLPRVEYDRLLKLDAEDKAEEEWARRVFAETQAKLDRGEEIFLPDETWTEIETGTHPIEAIRRYRGLTQTALAAQAGITQGFLSEIENRKKTGDVSVLKRIATALKAPLDVIVE